MLNQTNRFSFGFVAETAEGANGFCEAAVSMTRNSSVQFLGSSREKRRVWNELLKIIAAAATCCVVYFPGGNFAYFAYFTYFTYFWNEFLKKIAATTVWCVTYFVVGNFAYFAYCAHFTYFVWQKDIWRLYHLHLRQACNSWRAIRSGGYE